MKTSFDYIDSDAQLIEFSRKIASAKWIAVDTEFMRERTYYAQLALIQIGSEAASALIDAPALTSLEPLLEAFTRPDCLKIMHSASQDLEVLHQALGEIPAPLFDTQIAASFLGEADQIAYGAIVKQRLGVELEKDQTRTNWLQRPLSAAQLVYAQADVIYLHELFLQLSEELQQLDRLEWVYDESTALAAKTLLGFSPDLAWQRINSISRLSGHQQKVAIALANWRELRAQVKDLPREWVLKKQVLTTLAVAQPSTLSELGGIEGLSSKMVNRIGKPLIALISEAQSAAPTQTIELSALTQEQRTQAKGLMGRLREMGEQLKIAPSLIANRRSIEQLVLGERELPLLRGWRAAVAGNALLELLEA